LPTPATAPCGPDTTMGCRGPHTPPKPQGWCRESERIWRSVLNDLQQCTPRIWTHACLCLCAAARAPGATAGGTLLLSF
jgi:hypothetical protein